MKKHKLIFKERTEYELIFIEEGESFNEDFDIYEYTNQISTLEKKSGISILSDKDLVALYFDEENDSICGLLYTSSQGDFSFDVIVNPKYKRQGLGKKLIDLGLNMYEDYSEATGASLELDVVNKDLIKYLTKKGLEIVDTYSGHTIMRYEV